MNANFLVGCTDGDILIINVSGTTSTPSGSISFIIRQVACLSAAMASSLEASSSTCNASANANGHCDCVEGIVHFAKHNMVVSVGVDGRICIWDLAKGAKLRHCLDVADLHDDSEIAGYHSAQGEMNDGNEGNEGDDGDSAVDDGMQECHEEIIEFDDNDNHDEENDDDAMGMSSDDDCNPEDSTAESTVDPSDSSPFAHSIAITMIKSIDDDSFVVGDVLGCCSVWNVRTGELIEVLRGHSKGIMDIQVVNDGASSTRAKQIISAGDDGVCLVFNLHQ